MEKLRTQRSVLRRLFTNAANVFEKQLSESNPEESDTVCSFRKLGELSNKLHTLDEAIISALLEQAASEEDLLKEYESHDSYRSRWLSLEAKYEIQARVHRSVSESAKNSVISKTVDAKRKFRLPKLELIKFNDDIKTWVTFWGQFRKIHEDKEIDDDDKYQYLLQCMENGSNARRIVESFPPSGQNYYFALEQLRSRFAREDLLIVVYVREFLSSIILQSKAETKLPLNQLFDCLNAQLRALETLNVNKDKCAAFIYAMIESALPEDLLKAWERSRITNYKKDLIENDLVKLIEFIKLEVESEQRLVLAKSSLVNKNCLQNEPTSACLVAGSKTESHPVAKPCVWCDKFGHASLECFKIGRLSLEKRIEHLRKKKACTVCLRVGHSHKTCKPYIRCCICGQRHSVVLCPGSSKLEKPGNSTVNSASNDNNQNIVNYSSASTSKSSDVTLLQTIMLNVLYGNKKIKVRALYDNGSQRSYIKTEVAQKLGMKSSGKEVLNHALFGGIQTDYKVYDVYDFTVQSIDKMFTFNLNALGQPCVCGTIPRVNTTVNNLFNILKQHNVTITDKGDDLPEISLLIGADFSGMLMTTNIIKLNDALVAIETKLGWTLQGRQIGFSSKVNSLFCTANFDLTDFWSLEALGVKDPAEIKTRVQADAEVMMFFDNTVQTNSEGRYEVHLPWKTGFEGLQSNYDVAVRRLETMTKRLISVGKFCDYDAVFKEWCSLGIIEIVSGKAPSSGIHYLPHRAVVKDSSLTTKLRSVYDASAKDINGRSVNMCLERGINFLDRIPNLLIGFRKGCIGITADIAKAFLQISITPKDRDFLRFLWWKNKARNEMIIYRHRRVVFALTCSPFLLSATIMHHLGQVTGSLKDTARILSKTFYVDNCVTSLNSEVEVVKFIDEAKRVMALAKFDLRQWVTAPLCINDTGENIVSVLGLLWNTVTDELHCNMTDLPDVSTLTKVSKRLLLSLTQKIFDPIGFTSPVTLLPKLLLQEAWQQKLNWDEPLPADLWKRFFEWYECLSCLAKCTIPRRLTKHIITESTLSLHMFCDASKYAYAVCIFLRAECNGDISLRMVAAKSRIAPPKDISIPRLELMAALIGVRLLDETRKNLDLTDCKLFCWTDSSVVLYWIWKDLPWNTFVSNRVKEIRQKSSCNDWYHIPGSFNWADLASRGSNAKQFITLRWWEGPSWLLHSPENWPKSLVSLDERVAKIELRDVKTVANLVCSDQNFLNRLTYFSKYSKIIRMISWIRRFVNNSRKLQQLEGELSYEEFFEAENCIFRLIQKEHNLLSLQKSSKVLSMFVDSDGLIKIKTKLLLSELSPISTPILLPGKNCVVQRLVEQRHAQLQHAGSNAVIADLRSRLWILGIRRVVKSTISKCIVRKKCKGRALQAPCAPLPPERIGCSAVFEVTGIDLAGPLILRNNEKAWIVIFTCAVYRAIHLELVHACTTEVFLMALRRFIARRGRVKIIYSDNGTNFVGLSNYLDKLDWNEVKRVSTISRIKWKFNAPTAAWWGGFWERLIQILKGLLKRVLGKACVSYVELETLICDAESIMNSRPLTYIEDDTGEGLQPLTPSSFLQSIAASDVEDLDNIERTTMNVRLKYLQKLKSDLRQRFQSEYLTTLVQRGKQVRDSFKVGDIVLIETDERRVKWPLGRIEEIYPGRDSVGRTVKVKTSTGFKIRPCQKLYPLELSSETSPIRVSSEPNDSTDTDLSSVDVLIPRVTTRSGRIVRIPSRLSN